MNGGAAELTARAIIDTSLYLVLATPDGTGRPWSSPVYFAHHGYAEFFWASAPEAAHSRNIVVRPKVGIVIFDSARADRCRARRLHKCRRRTSRR